MKPIILNINEMSESIEAYEAKPKKAVIYTIYTIFALLVVALVWAYFFKVEINVDSDGIIKNDDEVVSVSTSVTGKISKCNVKDGQQVKKGDTLFTIDIENLDEVLADIKEKKDKASDKIKILTAYEKCIEGDDSEFDRLTDNPFYDEYKDRKNLLDSNIDANTSKASAQEKINNSNKKSLDSVIKTYNQKIEKLNEAKTCVLDRENTFDDNDAYYKSMVSSYISNYQITKAQYDRKIQEYKKQTETNLSNNNNSLEDEIQQIETEENQVLTNLETSQISTIEGQIENINNTLLSLNSSNQAQVSDNSIADVKNVYKLTEKGNVAKELASLKENQKEYENQIKNFNLKDKNCVIQADSTGYISLSGNFIKGNYIQEGSSLGQISPQKDEKFSAEIYVDNKDIAGIKEGQKVKFEMTSFPSKDYGEFSGIIKEISKDMRIDDKTGKAYYLVRASFDKNVISSKDGKNVNIMNGMLCRAKVITRKESVLDYLLKELNLKE